MLLLRLMKGNHEIWQWILLVTVLLPMTLTDIKTKRVNGYICLVSIFAALAIRVNIVNEMDIVLLIDMVPGILMYIISKLTNEKIGSGDALICLFIGAVVGVREVLLVISYAIVLAGIISFVLLIAKRVTKDTEIPFIPFLSIGVIAGGIV